MKSQSAARLSTALVVATATLSGCATKQDVRDLQSDLRMELREISARQDSLLAEFRFQTMQTQDTLQSASRELVDIRGTLLREIRDIGNQLARLEELAGQNQTSITQIRDQMGRAGAGRPATSFGPGGATAEDQLIPGTGGDPDEAYDFAMELYQRRSFVGAKAAFDDFLTMYPEDELAPLVHYNLGDIADQENRPDDAIRHFQRVGELFPNEDKVADALYRIGVIHMERDENSQARQIFQRIVNTYEERESTFLEGIVELAREALRELGG